MTSKELADLLDGNQYGQEITKEQEMAAADSNLVVVFGYSDDDVELRGEINDEVGAYKRCDPRVRRKCPDAGFCKGVFVEGSECDSLQSKLAEQVARREARLIDAGDLWSDIMMLPHNGDMISSEEVEQAIKDAPTVDAAPVVHGRWINWGKSGTPTYENYGTCSVCHEDAEICTEHRNYCPNCGAKMDGDGNEP